MPPQEQDQQYRRLPDGTWGGFPPGMKPEEVDSAIDSVYGKGEGIKTREAAPGAAVPPPGAPRGGAPAAKAPTESPLRARSPSEFFERAAGRLEEKAEREQTAEQARAARGEPTTIDRYLGPAMYGVRRGAADLSRLTGSFMTPQGIAAAVASRYLPVVTGMGFAGLGASQFKQGMEDYARTGHWTPENVQESLYGLAGVTGGAGGAAERIPRRPPGAATPGTIPEAARDLHPLMGRTHVEEVGERGPGQRPAGPERPATGGEPMGPIPPTTERPRGPVFGPRRPPPGAPGGATATIPAAPTERNVGWLPSREEIRAENLRKIAEGTERAFAPPEGTIPRTTMARP
ncbi:MAG: hypothetical protein HRJ53_13410, partial [Acidobacteria bacterium Pan2503]|nr:hypothetical protein [Candidatus Acidoferrum panamensis]